MIVGASASRRRRGGRVAPARATGARVEPGAKGVRCRRSDAPEGGVYEWYQRGVQLLGDGHPAAAATLLARAAEAEPGSRSILEALGRAQYDAGRYAEAMAAFTALIAVRPDRRLRPLRPRAWPRAGPATSALAAEHLALAVAMRPDLGHYARALRGVRARQAAESA